MIKKKHFSINLRPTQILVLGFLLMIMVGSILLNLPISSSNGKSIGYIDALFTATSAVCVTGLVVANTLVQWSVFGKIVILVLIQVGGLGFMTITTTLFILLGKKIRLKERLIIQEALNQYTLSGMVRLTRNIFLGTMFLEGLGAVLLSIRFVPEFGLRRGIFMGIFHSVSAFCNAGFDIVGGDSLMPYVGDILVNFTIMSLIVLGGIGFTVWIDSIRVLKEKKKYEYSLKKSFQRMSLHTKLTICLTMILIGLGFIFFLIIEGTNPGTLGQAGIKEKILGSLFQSVTTRTAGFNTIAQSQMADASKFLTIVFMFIGGSPGGTAGGIKTVTFGVIFLAVISVVKGKDDVEAFDKRISWDIVKKSLAVVVISLIVVIFVTIVLSLTQVTNRFPFMDLFFEAVSGFATVGLSLGVTPHLTVIGKILLSITMFIGRLGPVTMVVAFSLKDKRSIKATIKKPEEKVMVG